MRSWKILLSETLANHSQSMWAAWIWVNQWAASVKQPPMYYFIFLSWKRTLLRRWHGHKIYQLNDIMEEYLIHHSITGYMNSLHYLFIHSRISLHVCIDGYMFLGRYTDVIKRFERWGDELLDSAPLALPGHLTWQNSRRWLAYVHCGTI